MAAIAKLTSHISHLNKLDCDRIAWEQRKVQDVADRFDNLRIPVAANLRVHGTTPYYGANGIQDYVEGFTHDGEFVLVAEDGANDLKNYPVKCVNGRIWVNNHAHILQGKAGIADNSFLAFAISQSDIESLLVGGGRAKLNAETLMSIEFRLPCLQEQYRIGEYLTQLDHLITLHQRKCVFLFGFFQAFISMIFTASTFSWEQRKVSDLAEKTYGGGTPTTSNEAYWNGDIPWIQSSDVVDGKLLGVEPRKWITQDGLNNSAAQLIPGNSIAIITRVGVGKLAFMPYSYATSQDFLSLSKLNAEPLFTVYACYKKLQSELNAVQGTSIKGITKDELLAKNIMVPRYAEQQQIGAFFKQLDNLITLHQRECISFTARAGRLILTANKKRNTSSWEQRKLGDVVKEITRNDPESEAPIMMITANNGFIEQSERYAFNNAGESLKKYILLKKGELAYNHGASKLRPYGSCFALTTAENARIPFVYHCFSAENQNAEFMSIELNGAEIENQLRKIVSSGARMDGLLNISFDEYTSVSVILPGTEEQDRIADFFRHLDNLITLHQRKCALLFSSFQALISLIFTTSTFSWEQRKFSELVQIERGGSPRPIDDFITDAPNGLNWVKIGDAPTQGNYITKTAEKIRPEGLSKTREVHPGDLILSNSMSFGKPYIMGIDGCIHDGWLLIRNTYGVFDLTFLCHLLGTPQMLSQYRSLAAGSTVNNLNKELVGNTVVTIPSITEQRVLGDYLEQLDNLITLHQRELEKLQNIKKSMLEKMFV